VRCCHWCANDAHKDDRGADQLSDVLIHCLIPKNKTKLMLEKIATKNHMDILHGILVQYGFTESVQEKRLL
jgi:5,10-methylene-tetrahydrofolate dehydrogenase/methenyl tetrahydrofolate cyclohydrolase